MPSRFEHDSALTDEPQSLTRGHAGEDCTNSSALGLGECGRALRVKRSSILSCKAACENERGAFHGTIALFTGVSIPNDRGGPMRFASIREKSITHVFPPSVDRSAVQEN